MEADNADEIRLSAPFGMAHNNIKPRLEADCNLTRYLAALSSRSFDEKATFAAIMLVHLGYFSRFEKHPELTEIHELIHNPTPGDGGPPLAEMSAICSSCSFAAECSVGAVIIQQPKPDAAP